MIRIADALQSLRPNSQFAVRGNDVIEWLDTEQTQPSKSEIDAEVIRLQAEYDAKEYARKRALEKPLVNAVPPLATGVAPVNIFATSVLLSAMFYSFGLSVLTLL